MIPLYHLLRFYFRTFARFLLFIDFYFTSVSLSSFSNLLTSYVHMFQGISSIFFHMYIGTSMSFLCFDP
jgi:hypothetical protein